mgnify:CR=1 FL=1|tara:strand:- start:60192 stop:60794 length:603 start_codon:yes stop_codon:yes gene_type:complete
MSNKKAYFTVGALALIFIGPMLAAWIVFVIQPTWLANTVNRGHLIQPPLNFSQLILHKQNNDAVAKVPGNGKWRMVFVSPLPCGKICQDNIHKMRQVERSFLDKQKTRVDRIWLTYQPIRDGKLLGVLHREYPGMQAYVVSKQQFAAFSKALPSRVKAMQVGYLYFVDPNNNLFMSYAPDAKYKDILKDLTKLMKVSQIG